MNTQVYESELAKMNKLLKDNAQKFHDLFPHNPILSKDDEWVNEKQWDDLYEDLKRNEQKEN